MFCWVIHVCDAFLLAFELRAVRFSFKFWLKLFLDKHLLPAVALGTLEKLKLNFLENRFIILSVHSAVAFLRCKSHISFLKFKTEMMWIRLVMAVWHPKENEINPVRMTSAPKVLIMLECDTLWLKGIWWKQELVNYLFLVSFRLAPLKELTDSVFQESKNKDSCADRRSDVVWNFFLIPEKQ